MTDSGMTDVATLAFIGDVMLGRGVNEEILRRTAAGKPTFTPEFFWGDVLPILKGADAVFANLECAITQSTQPCRRIAKLFHFRADPVAVEVLRAANIQCVSLANNHSLDFDDQGLLDTLHNLDTAQIHHAGAGRNLDEAIAPAMLTIANLSVGFMALTDNTIAFAAAPDRPGTWYLSIKPEPEVLAIVEDSVNQMHQAGANFVILSAHWGPNMVTSPPQRFRAFAHAVIDSGVDLFYGHSAHLFQAVECYNQRLILYDTGDFLDDYIVDPVLRNDWSFVFLVTASASRIHRLRLIPVRLHYAQVELARDQEFADICTRMRSLCTEFNTPISDIPEGLEVVFAKGSPGTIDHAITRTEQR
jgi:poly-gamma-glutamate synthesis protein (capsule biosynthesis protein)